MRSSFRLARLFGIEVGAHAMIGAGAVVTHDITEPGIYAGNPARLLRRDFGSREGAKLAK